MNIFYFIVLFFVYPFAFLFLYRVMIKAIDRMEYIESCFIVLEKQACFDEEIKTRFMRDHAFERKSNFKEGDSGEGD